MQGSLRDDGRESVMPKQWQLRLTETGAFSYLLKKSHGVASLSHAFVADAKFYVRMKNRRLSVRILHFRALSGPYFVRVVHETLFSTSGCRIGM